MLVIMRTSELMSYVASFILSGFKGNELVDRLIK